MYFERIVAAPPAHVYYDIAHVRGKKGREQRESKQP